MKPRFSIIVPLYNKVPYVRKALSSIVAQTYKDWECIVINDGSSDNSLEVVKNFVGEFKIYDLRFKIVDQSNAGVAAARNNGVIASHGEYVCFLDADDWWEPTFLEEMAKLINEYPEAGIYASNYIYYKPGKTHVALQLERGYIDYPKAYYEGSAMPVWTGATCMPRKVFDEMGGFPLGIKLGEDFLLWAKTAIHYPVAYSEKPLAYYNNDVPATMRATRNLHAPQYHMLFHLEPLEEEIQQTSNIKHQTLVWKLLLDKLRVSGLMDYWLSDEYHDAAAIELAKVDWGKQPHNAKSQYEKPIWFLKVKRRFMQIGSYFKQKVIKMPKRQLVLLSVFFYVINGFSLDVIFRYDDFLLKENIIQNKLVNIYAVEQVPLHIAVIPCNEDSSYIIEEGEYLEYLKRLQKDGILQIALHGFCHKGNAKYGEFLNLNEDEQRYRLKKGTQFLDSVFDTQVHIFIPPWNRYNQKTLDVLYDLGYTIVSSSYSEDQYLEDARYQYYLAEEIPPYMLKEQLEKMATREGLLVCLFHPNDFYNASAFKDMQKVLEIAKSCDSIHILTMDELYAIDQSFGERRISANFPQLWLTKVSLTYRIVLLEEEAKKIRYYNVLLYVVIVLIEGAIILIAAKRTKFISHMKDKIYNHYHI